MRRAMRRLVVLLACFAFMLLPPAAAMAETGRLVYDHAGLLSDSEEAALAARAAELGAKRETAFIVITLNGTDGKDIVDYVADFYDETAPGYDKPHGNAAILAIDLKERDVFLAAFKIAETYLDGARLDKIREAITPYLSDGRFFEAFMLYVEMACDYMGYRPGVNPDSLLFKTSFQAAVSLGVAAGVVAALFVRTRGRVTVTSRTYLNASRSRVVRQTDRFTHKHVTRTKIERNKSGGGFRGGGGSFGGGVTRGGHSFSGSRGKF